jgi:hypothetical protein
VTVRTLRGGTGRGGGGEVDIDGIGPAHPALSGDPSQIDPMNHRETVETLFCTVKTSSPQPA